VLQIVETDEVGVADPDAGGSSADSNHPFIRYDRRMAWAAFAESHGYDHKQRAQLVAEVDDAVADLDGPRFHETPFGRDSELSDRLGFSRAGGVWVKDETGGVGGSQKSRHLLSILLHLRVAEQLGQPAPRPPLAIASCGNAALAAALLARASGWPIDVYVPTWMTDAFGRQLDRFGARVHRCHRRATDPPGDPAMLRFREAVADGAIPFTVQGPENALCLDGGRTLGWEIADQLATTGRRLRRIFIQVGGGAFASSVGSALDRSIAVHAVQAAGCAPLARAWQRADGRTAPADISTRWSELMQVWAEPASLADGILDDETYDWIGVFETMDRSGGHPVVAAEADIVAAHADAVAAGYESSPTGSAGLAGVIAAGRRVGRDENVAVVMSGRGR
jgi:threonine dehydratase